MTRCVFFSVTSTPNSRMVRSLMGGKELSRSASKPSHGSVYPPPAWCFQRRASLGKQALESSPLNGGAFPECTPGVRSFTNSVLRVLGSPQIKLLGECPTRPSKRWDNRTEGCCYRTGRGWASQPGVSPFDLSQQLLVQ